MKAAQYILTIAGVLLAVCLCKAQTQVADTATNDSTTVVAKTKLYDTGSVNHFCATCAEAVEVNNSHVMPYYQENKPYTDANKAANTKAGVLSQDSGRPSIKGARPSGTAYYYNGIRLLETTPIRVPAAPF